MKIFPANKKVFSYKFLVKVITIISFIICSKHKNLLKHLLNRRVK